MKALLLTLAILIFAIELCANPIMPMILSEVWFTNEGHCMVEFYDWWIDGFWDDYPIVIGDGVTSALTPYCLADIGPDSICVVDITQEFPNLSFNPQSGRMVIYLRADADSFEVDAVTWGYELNDMIHQLMPGQSMVHWNNNYDDGWTHFAWYKDEPPTPGITAGPVARDTVIVQITDINSNPIPNVPVYNYQTYQYDSYTDSLGVYKVVMYAGKFFLKIKHPQTLEIIHDQQYWLEPNEITVIPITINITANADEVVPVIYKGLHAYPNPFNGTMSGSVTFTYDGNTKLSRESYLRIYDTKGRFISKVEMNSKGTANWQPDTTTASGLYVARLISGNSIVDTATFSVIK